MKLTKAERELKQVVLEVNRTLPVYEKDWISVKRTPESEEKERCTCFEQFIEARFNYEFCKRYTEFSDLINFLEGKAFKCTLLEEPDEIKRRFKNVEITLIDPSIVQDPSDLFLSEYQRLRTWLGGSIISFNSVRKKIRIKIKKV